MTLKPAMWYPIAVVLSLANVVSVWFAAVPAQPLHATTHAVLGVAFGVWAYRLRQRVGRSKRRVGIDAAEALDALEAAEAEMTKLRQELGEAQSSLDFAERQLAQAPAARRVERP